MNLAQAQQSVVVAVLHLAGWGVWRLERHAQMHAQLGLLCRVTGMITKNPDISLAWLLARTLSAHSFDQTGSYGRRHLAGGFLYGEEACVRVSAACSL